MKRNNSIKRKILNKKGFTLVELIVVMAVIAIIAAISVPRFLGVQEQAKIDADISTASMIAKASELYIVSENIALPATTDTTSVTLEKLCTGSKYMDEKTLFQYHKNNAEGTLADVQISIDSTGKATVIGKNKDSSAFDKILYPAYEDYTAPTT